MEFKKADLIALVPDPEKILNVWDEDTPGLALRITPGGVKTFVFKHRVGKRQVWMKLGRFGEMTIDAARKRASAIRDQVGQGKDPAQEVRARRTAMTVKEAAEKMLEEHEPHVRTSTFKDYKHLVLDEIIPELGNLTIKELTPADVARLHHGLRATPRKANVTLVVLSLICKYTEEWGERELGTNPCQHRKRYRTAARHRYLTDAELLAVGSTLDKLERTLGDSSADCLRLIILTGARKSEITKLRWDQVDLEGKRLGFGPKDHKTGGFSYAKQIPLGDPAVELLQHLHDIKDDGMTWVFPGRSDGKSIRTVDKAWFLVRDTASKEGGVDVTDVHIHDLRHTWGATATTGGHALQTIGAVMGHKHQATTQRYAHVAPSPAAQVAQATSKKLAAAMLGNPKKKEPAREKPRRPGSKK